MFSTQLTSNGVSIRIDVIGGPEITQLVEDDTFLNYRLGDVKVSNEITCDEAGIVWNRDIAEKTIKYENGVLQLTGPWEEGELQKIEVSMLANELDKNGLHPMHSSSVIYRGKMILLVGGENNHGKSMTQLAAAKLGASVFSTETTVADETGLCLYGSKNTFIRKRAKGTERSDLGNQDEGVAKFFDKEPEMTYAYDPCRVDIAILPCIDGWFDTKVTKVGQFEAAYQEFHSLMNFFGMNQLLCGVNGLAMPIIDEEDRRQHRAQWCKDFAASAPFYMMRAKTPQIILEELDKIIDEMEK